MKKLLLVGVLGMCVSLLASCQDDDIMLDTGKTGTTTQSSSEYAISPEDALATLTDFWGDSNSSSRGNDGRKVESIIPIKYRPRTSRAEVDTIVCVNLMYIANFENANGYAILAADKRIPDKIIALVDKGTLSESIVRIAIERLDDGKVIFKDYPRTGPGFFTDPRYGEELFINPNTVTFEDLAKQDTLVGNFCMENSREENDKGFLVNSGQEEDDTYIQLYTSYMCASYADRALTFQYNPDAMEPLDPIGGNVGFHNRTETFYSDWIVNQQTTNLLSNYCEWKQSSPFNDLYPKRRKWIVFGHQAKAPAGCFPLAIAKVLTHFAYPDNFSYKGNRINWAFLGFSPRFSIFDRESAARLLRRISDDCDCLYFYNGTWTFPSNASSFMQSIGYTNVHRYNYTFERVRCMIDLGNPVIIYAIPGVNIFSSHAWNIDGYKIKERTKTTKKYDGTRLIETITETETFDMVHCDFGWGGKCNGYYVSGVFKLNDSNSEKDNPNDGGKKTNYNHHVRIITYEK